MSSIWDSSSISTLLGSTSGIAASLGDYASIRNGSYGKLLKSYYGDSSSTTSTTGKSSTNYLDEILNERKNPTVSKEAASANSLLSSSADSLKSSLSTLQDSSTYEKTASDIATSAESFIKSYNDTVTSAKSSAISGVTSNLSGMMTKTASNSTALSAIGISVGNDGKLTMDSDKFKNADMATVKDVLQKYATSIQSNASLINFYSDTGSTTASAYTATGSYSSAGSDLVSGLFSGYS